MLKSEINYLSGKITSLQDQDIQRLRERVTKLDIDVYAVKVNMQPAVKLNNGVIPAEIPSTMRQDTGPEGGSASGNI